jgi:hypothetical protein
MTAELAAARAELTGWLRALAAAGSSPAAAPADRPVPTEHRDPAQGSAGSGFLAAPVPAPPGRDPHESGPAARQEQHGPDPLPAPVVAEQVAAQTLSAPAASAATAQTPVQEIPWPAVGPGVLEHGVARHGFAADSTTTQAVSAPSSPARSSSAQSDQTVPDQAVPDQVAPDRAAPDPRGADRFARHPDASTSSPGTGPGGIAAPAGPEPGSRAGSAPGPDLANALAPLLPSAAFPAATPFGAAAAPPSFRAVPDATAATGAVPDHLNVDDLADLLAGVLEDSARAMGVLELEP